MDKIAFRSFGCLLMAIALVLFFGAVSLALGPEMAKGLLLLLGQAAVGILVFLVVVVLFVLGFAIFTE